MKIARFLLVLQYRIKIEKRCQNVYDSILPMKITVVIPAFNEEKLLARCIESVRAAFSVSGGGADHEIVVCDNNSTDGTAGVAAALGVRTVFEPLNRISGSRNTGASAAAGDWLIFLDADSALSPATLSETLRRMRSGACVGGGALVAFEDPEPPFWGAVLTGLWNLISRTLNLAAGSYLFCRSDAFRWLGGFSPELYAAEEIVLSRGLKRWGAGRGLHFDIIRSSPHISSGRKFRLYTLADLLSESFRFWRRPFRAVKDPARLRIFYEGRR